MTTSRIATRRPGRTSTCTLREPGIGPVVTSRAAILRLWTFISCLRRYPEPLPARARESGHPVLDSRVRGNERRTRRSFPASAFLGGCVLRGCAVTHEAQPGAEREHDDPGAGDQARLREHCAAGRLGKLWEDDARDAAAHGAPAKPRDDHAPIGGPAI